MLRQGAHLFEEEGETLKEYRCARCGMRARYRDGWEFSLDDFVTSVRAGRDAFEAPPCAPRKRLAGTEADFEAGKVRT